MFGEPDVARDDPRYSPPVAVHSGWTTAELVRDRAGPGDMATADRDRDDYRDRDRDDYRDRSAHG